MRGGQLRILKGTVVVYLGVLFLYLPEGTAENVEGLRIAGSTVKTSTRHVYSASS
jgi:hypothetical protein